MLAAAATRARRRSRRRRRRTCRPPRTGGRTWSRSATRRPTGGDAVRRKRCGIAFDRGERLDGDVVGARRGRGRRRRCRRGSVGAVMSAILGAAAVGRAPADRERHRRAAARRRRGRTAPNARVDVDVGVGRCASSTNAAPSRSSAVDAVACVACACTSVSLGSTSTRSAKPAGPSARATRLAGGELVVGQLACRRPRAARRPPRRAPRSGACCGPRRRWSTSLADRRTLDEVGRARRGLELGRRSTRAAGVVRRPSSMPAKVPQRWSGEARRTAASRIVSRRRCTPVRG